jgi:hypothetical protein
MSERTPPANPTGPVPTRRAASIRRTSTIDTDWPEGVGRPTRMQGRARDLWTPRDLSQPHVIAEDSLDAVVTPQRQILKIRCLPARAAIGGLVGCRGGGHLRAELLRLLPDERQRGTPLYLLLDDLSGASLVAGWSWSVWLDDWQDQRSSGAMAAAGRKSTMAGICIGYRRLYAFERCAPFHGGGADVISGSGIERLVRYATVSSP